VLVCSPKEQGLAGDNDPSIVESLKGSLAHYFCRAIIKYAARKIKIRKEAHKEIRIKKE
jgi:hypothetical protein